MLPNLVLDDFEEHTLEVATIHEALIRLAGWDEHQDEVMTLRFFGGPTISEVDMALGVLPVTVERDWELARAWLRDQFRGGDA